jgi:hypothetical protein
VLEDYEAQEPEANKIGDGYPGCVTFPGGETEATYGNFNSRVDAIRWTRREAVVWLYQRRESQKRIAG